MARGFGLLSLIVSLAIVGVLVSSQLGKSPTPADAKQNGPVAEANAAAAGLTAVQAERQLGAYQAANGTFAGATLTGISSARILHADATSFCLQVSSAGTALYDAGPGGTLTTQRC